MTHSYHTHLLLFMCIFTENHFIKAESMTTENIFPISFLFDKIDFVKKYESSWSTDDVQMMALIMTMKINRRQ